MVDGNVKQNKEVTVHNLGWGMVSSTNPFLVDNILNVNLVYTPFPRQIFYSFLLLCTLPITTVLLSKCFLFDQILLTSDEKLLLVFSI